MKANRTHQYPPKTENLGDGTFYYNFNVVESKTEEGEPNFDYDQVRCSYPVEVAKIETCLKKEGYKDHQVDLTGYEEI